jgi:hypothetical protein
VFSSAFSPAQLFVGDEEAMGITAIVFALIILLFGFDSIGRVKTRQKRNWLRKVLGAVQMMP